MRTFEYIAVALTAGLALAAVPASAFEGTTVGQDSAASLAPPQMPISPPPVVRVARAGTMARIRPARSATTW